MQKIQNENTIITWRLDVACKALSEALQDEEAVKRYLKMKNLEVHEVHLKDIGWVRKVS